METRVQRTKILTDVFNVIIRKFHDYDKEVYAYCVKCTCNVFKERIKIIAVYILYDSAAPKLQKNSLTTVTNNYYL